MTKQTTDSNNTAFKAGFKPGPWIACAVLVLGLAVLAGLYWDQNVTVQNVRFEGNHFVSTRELSQQVKVPTGIKPDSIDFMKIIRQAERILYVKKTGISVEPGGNLIVNITERQPVAQLRNGDEKCYIDLDGVKLPIVQGKPVDVPILYGFKVGAADTLRGKAFSAVRDFLAELNKKPVSKTTISEIAWTEDEGVVALTTENGVKLLFGRKEFEKRLRNWEAFLGEVVRTKGIAGMRSIDLRFRGQIVTQES